jgi:glycosyltransferase involved in cell wall biosynthesis
VGGPKALIDNGINGMLVPVRDKDAMANALRNIITDNKKADMIGKEAAKITKKLSPEIIYGQWEDFINEIIGEKVTEK